MGNDVSIITGIIGVFIIVGVFLPILQDGYGVLDPDVNDVDEILLDLTNSSIELGEKTSVIDVASIGSLGFFDIVKSILKMFFWTFGALPAWLDLIFVIFRITLFILLVRLIRSGAG